MKCIVTFNGNSGAKKADLIALLSDQVESPNAQDDEVADEIEKISAEDDLTKLEEYDEESSRDWKVSLLEPGSGMNNSLNNQI